MDMSSMTTSSNATSSTAVACKISMLWNWYTIDTCFISSTWHIRSTSMFAGSCIGVILLTMSLELLRRTSKEYERYILKQHQRKQSTSFPNPTYNDDTTASTTAQASTLNSDHKKSTGPITTTTSSITTNPHKTSRPKPFRPSLVQQVIRASLHMVTFGVAYFVMLLAMYYNGYFIICILVGAWLGAFFFSWEAIAQSDEKEEVTFCCG